MESDPIVHPLPALVVCGPRRCDTVVVASFVDTFGLRVPIVQAPIGACAGPDLVAAVAEAGGLGLLAGTWATPAALRETVAQVREQSSGLFGCNLVLRFPIDDQLDALLEEAVPIITFSWGHPGAERVRRCQAAGARVVVQVGNAAAVDALVDDGVDALIAQGVEAGGHVQSSTPLAQLLPDVLARAGSVPVIAAGGLTSRDDVRGVIDQGARAAMLGTRFVATRESLAHPDYKARLVESDSTAAVLTLAFDGDWPFGPHRVLRNSTFVEWEAAGCPWPGERPGEDDIVLTRGSLSIRRYADHEPLAGDVGEVEAACLYAGLGTGGISDLPGAGELVTRLAPLPSHHP